MQPIHLAIGLAEGIITAGVILYIKQARPEILVANIASRPMDARISIKNILAVFVILAIITGGAISWFASTHPDGLEWSIKKITGAGELAESTSGIASALKTLQEKTSFLPDYGFKPAAGEESSDEAALAWPDIEAGTSAAGVIGAAITLLFIIFIGFVIRLFKRP